MLVVFSVSACSAKYRRRDEKSGFNGSRRSAAASSPVSLATTRSVPRRSSRAPPPRPTSFAPIWSASRTAGSSSVASPCP